MVNHIVHHIVHIGVTDYNYIETVNSYTHEEGVRDYLTKRGYDYSLFDPRGVIILQFFDKEEYTKFVLTYM